jgi:hypothetical protein
MCLSSKDKVPLEVTEGYKIFKKGAKNKLIGQIYGGDKVYPKRKWINEKDFRENPEKTHISVEMEMKTYKTGFHFYIEKSAALYNASIFSNVEVYKVKVKNITATGTQGGWRMRVGVAKDIKICEHISRKEICKISYLDIKGE